MGPQAKIVVIGSSEPWSHSDPPRPDGSRNTAMRQVDASVDEDGTGAGAGGSSGYWRSSPDGSLRARCAGRDILRLFCVYAG